MRRFALLLFVLALVFSAFVWPTRWRFDHISVDGDTYLVRVNRITGHADILVPETGWVPAEDPWDESPSPQTDQHT